MKKIPAWRYSGASWSDREIKIEIDAPVVNPPAIYYVEAPPLVNGDDEIQRWVYQFVALKCQTEWWGALLPEEEEPVANTTTENSENSGAAARGCFGCGEPLILHTGDMMVSTFEMVSGSLSQERWYHRTCLPPAVLNQGPQSEQLESQIAATQGPWSSVELHRNSKGFTHDLKLYFPPEWTGEQVETRLVELQRVIEKLESIGSEGRHVIE